MKFSFILFLAISVAGPALASPADAARNLITSVAIQAVDKPLLVIARHFIHLHGRELGIYLPLPQQSSIAPQDVADRINALVAAENYGRTIVEGLSAAAADDKKREEIRQDLAPAISDMETVIFKTLVQLLNAPDAATHGWFITTRFGSHTERNAGQLLLSARHERAFLAMLRDRVERLANDGEASSATMEIIIDLLDHPPTVTEHFGDASG